MFSLRNLGLPSDYADAGSVQTAKFQRPADAYSKSSVFAAQGGNAYPGTAVAGEQCPPGTVQQGLVCAQIPQPNPPVQPPPTCPAGMYWNGGECASLQPPLPPPSPSTPPPPFFDVEQKPTTTTYQPPSAGTVVITDPGVVVPPGYFRLGSSVYPKWWAYLAGALAVGGGYYWYKRRA